MRKCYLFIFLFLAFCTQAPPQKKSPLVLAFVNGQALFDSNLTYRLDLEKAKFSDKTLSNTDFFETLKNNVLQEMITHKAIADWGRKRNILLTEEELAQGIQQIKNGFTEKSFEAFLEAKNITLAHWRLIAEEQILVKKIINQEVISHIEVTPKEVSQYYSSHLDQFKIPESVRARQIVTDTQEKAQKIMDLLNHGENFAKVAIMHSLSPDRASGGDLGYFFKGTHPDVFDNTCFNLNPGQLSPIVKSNYGFHIFKLISKKPSRTKSLDESTAEIYSLLAKNKMTEAYKVWLDSVLKESQIQVIEENVKKITFQGYL